MKNLIVKITAAIIILTFGITYMVSFDKDCFPSPTTAKIPVAVEYFKINQVLLPDCACPDTLIVRNAKGLNAAMALIEQGIIDASDSSIDSTFHVYCDYFVGSFEDQCNKLKVLQPTWDNNAITIAINED